MTCRNHAHRTAARRSGTATAAVSLCLIAALVSTTACATSTSSSGTATSSRLARIPDPRVGLRGGKTDAAEVGWNIRRVSTTPPPEKFADVMNSDLAFIGHYAI